MSWTARGLAAAMRLLPRRFRVRFGNDLAELAGALARDAHEAGGRRAQLAYWGRELAGLARLAFALRRADASSPTVHAASEGTPMFESMTGDLRWALRHAWRRPLFSLTVSATLAFSIAAATTAFGLGSAVLWRPLPFADASRLVFVWEETEREGQRAPSRVTGGRYAAWRDHSRSFASLALFGASGFTIDEPGGVSAVRGVRVSPAYFDTLGVRPLLGRAFAASEGTPGRHQVVLLSHALWQQRFGGRADIIGDTLRLSGQPYAVLGVMPPIVYPAWPVNPAIVTLDGESTQLWVPIAGTPELDQNHRSHVFGVVGRLDPGVSIAHATAELTSLVSPASPDPHGARLTPLREQFVRDARTPLLALLGAALAVLLVACANLAALHISAFEARRNEIGVRAAIGAGVGRLARQLAAEALLLAALGGVAGLLLARGVLLVLPGFLPSSIPLLTAPALDATGAAFAMVVALTAGLLLAAWPVGRLLVAAPAPRGVAARPRGHVYRVLVVSQIAITVALVACAGLLARSLWSVRAQDPGFVIDRVLVADIGVAGAAYRTPESIVSFEQRLQEVLASTPGVSAAAIAYDHPLEANWSDAYTLVGDAAIQQGDAGGQAELRIVSPSYFETMGVEILDGRPFGERDGLGAAGVAVVNEAFAAAAAGRLLGRRLRSVSARLTWGPSVPEEFAIVGIAENERVRGLEQPATPAVYLSTRQFPQHSFAVLARTTGDPIDLVADVRRAVRSVDATATIARPASLASILADQLIARRVTTEVIGGFAGAALALAALGLYGLLAVLVSSRTREIGVRLALGASPGRVARQVVGESLGNAVAGVAAGFVLALAAGRLLENLLVGVSARDPLTLATVTATLLVVAALAALLPAWRAARVDPARALRAD